MPSPTKGSPKKGGGDGEDANDPKGRKSRAQSVMTTADAESQLWTLTERLAEMKGVYHVFKKQSEAQRYESKNKISSKVNEITKATHDIKETHARIGKEGSDFKVIEKVVGNNKKILKRFQTKSCDDLIDKLDSDSCEAVKLLDNIRYECCLKERKLHEMGKEAERLKRDPYIDKELGRQIIKLENDLDKAKIKEETASIIGHRYYEILTVLKNDSIYLPGKLESLEKLLASKKDLHKRLQEVSLSSWEAHFSAKKMLSNNEFEAILEKRKRDADVAKKRYVAMEQRKVNGDRTDLKRAKLMMLQEKRGQMKAMKEKQKNNEKILEYEEALQKLREATHVSEHKEVVKTVTTQASTQSTLKNHILDLEREKGKLQRDLTELHKKFHDIKYTGEERLSKGERLLERMHQQVEEEGQKCLLIKQQLENKAKIIINLKGAFTNLLDKLQEIRLTPPEKSYTDDLVINQSELCLKKVVQLVKRIDLVNLPAKCSVEEQQFQEFLESRVPQENIRVQLDKVPSEEEYFQQMDEVNILTRHDLKKFATKLVDVMEKRGQITTTKKIAVPPKD